MHCNDIGLKLEELSPVYGLSKVLAADIKLPWHKIEVSVNSLCTDIWRAASSGGVAVLPGYTEEL